MESALLGSQLIGSLRSCPLVADRQAEDHVILFKYTLKYTVMMSYSFSSVADFDSTVA